MGAYSEMDLDMQYDSDNPFISDGEVSAPIQAVSQDQQASGSVASTRPQPSPTDEASKKKSADGAAAKHAAEEDEKRRAHEEAEAKRKAEWEARQQAKKAAEQEQLDKLAAMSDDEVMLAATKRVGDDLEKLTRRSMREFVTEHIQTKCLDDPAFARKVMHPRKSMIRCFWFINRKAQEFILKKMELRGEKPERFERIGGDVPDDICYQWAEDYFNDPNTEEDKDEDAEFVPKPYHGGPYSTVSSKTATSKKQEATKPETRKRATSKDNDMGQITLGDLGALKESA